MELVILHQDAAILAVDKPAGHLVIPGRDRAEPTVQAEAEARFGRLWIVHRLDRGTSGVLLFARTAEAHRALNLAFEGRAVEKRYLALVEGEPPDHARHDAALAPARRGRMRPARPGEAGKPAVTEVAVLERFAATPQRPAFALVEARPRTGRTHQIRVHLAWAGTPLAVDPDYGEPGPRALGGAALARTPLHAAALELAHPVTGERLALEAPLPGDLRAVLEALRR